LTFQIIFFIKSSEIRKRKNLAKENFQLFLQDKFQQLFSIPPFSLTHSFSADKKHPLVFFAFASISPICVGMGGPIILKAAHFLKIVEKRMEKWLVFFSYNFIGRIISFFGQGDVNKLRYLVSREGSHFCKMY